MEKYLYFAQGDGANATSEAVMYPVSAFRGADVASSAIQLWFTGAESSNQTAEDNEDLVTLTITDGDQKAVLKSLAEKMAGATGPLQVPFIVVADEDNSIFCHSSITAVEITLSA
tara:strand:+ start:576 stop:920 length:345 start_codon:yes stop_codon:yes gene_type:complete